MRANLDALERLAFMASFDNGRKAIAHATNARQTLASLLEHPKDWVRICAAMTYFEVGWEWPLQSNDTSAELEGLERLATDVEHPLHDKNKDRQLYACISLPSLCKNSWLRKRLLKDDNLRRLVQLTNACKAGCNRKKEEEGVSASTVALHSAQALTSLLELDESSAPKLLAMGGVAELVHALHNDHDAVLVAVLRTLCSLVGYGDSHAIMSRENIVPTLMGLAQRCDDFVAPAAVELACPIAVDESMRAAFVKSGALPLFNDMLRRPSDAVMEAGAQGLATFAKHDELSIDKSGLLMKLAKDARNSRANHCDGCIRGLVALNVQVPTLVQRALEEARTVSDLICQLRRKSHALPAASALAHLMAIDRVLNMVTESNAPKYLLNMLERRWFDGDNGEDGVEVLQRILKIGPLRNIILNPGAVDMLQSMVAGESSHIVYAGLQYLQEVMKYDDGKSIACREAMIPPLLKALDHPRLPLQRSAAAILRAVFMHSEPLRFAIVKGLLSKLKSRQAAELLGVTTTLRVLSFDEEVRHSVCTDENFWSLSYDYYNVLKLQYDKESPSFRDVYQSVGFLIKCVQGVVSHRQPDDSQWLESAPYEFRKDHNTVQRLTNTLERLSLPLSTLFHALNRH
ncbi:armadillo-type protein [Pisolithus thermaeus]|nr:armadillo-type protein [Pisolithus thermaeus]